MKAVTPLAPLLRVSATFLFVVASVGNLLAQAANTGSIEGRVFDAARGEYLENARITVEGTSIEAFTDAGGFYQLGRVPAGEVKVRAFFTGLVAPTEAVRVTAGQATTKDFALARPGQPGAASGDPVKLSEFVVATSKEMDAAAIAINEQRVAPNIKSVVAADEFGTIVDGTPGEAIKFLPGVILNYSAGEAREVSINGVPTASVPVTIGGFDLASNAGGGTGRQVNFEQVSINSMSRIEVIHSPTPESQGSALAGSVNMVPRSAFERSKPSFNYSVYMMMKDSAKSFDKSPAPLRRIESKITPGFTANLIMPVNRKFGFTLSANYAHQWVPNDIIALGRRGTDLVTNGNAFPDTTPDKPYLTDVEVTDDLRRNTTTSAGATFDYKLSPVDTLSLSTQYTYVTVEHIGHRLSFFITGVRPGDFSTTHTHGAPGQGTLQLSDVNSRYWLGSTSIATLTYRHNGSVWKAESGAGFSYAGQHNRDIARGILRNSTARRTGLTIKFDDNFYQRPGRITVTDASGAPVDPYKLENYALTAANYQDDNWLTYRTTFYGNLQRHFDVRGVPMALKAGFDVRRLERDVRGPQVALTPAVTPNQNAPGSNNAAQFLDTELSQRTLPYGFQAAQWVDDAKLYQHWIQNPGYFTTNENAIYRSRVTVSKRMAETVSAGFLRADAAFFNRRLQFVGGVRGEQTNSLGEGPLTDPTRNFQRDAQGNILRGANGAPLPIVTPVNTNNLAYSQLTFIDRGSRTEKEYLRILPNLNVIYNARENLRIQAAYYHSLGRPNFNQYAGGITLPNTDDPRSDANPITVNNAAIKAWKAETYKVRAEYYFERVGQFSVSLFRRDFENFFGSTRFAATPEFLQLYSLDPNLYSGFTVVTNYNIPDPVRTTGVELAYRQALTFLPHWARGVQVFANTTIQRIQGEASANFNASFIPKSGSWGVSFTRPKYNVKANWNYRGEQRRAAVTGRGIEPGTFTYSAPRLYLDISAEYYRHRKFGLFAGFRNLANVTEDTDVYGPSTPEIAQFSQRNDYSASWTFGVKGTF